MPRENRKRGKRGNKQNNIVKDDDRIQEQETVNRNYKEEHFDTQNGNHTQDHEHEQEEPEEIVEPEWPLLDPDSKAYLLSINQKILELDDLVKHSDEEEQEDRLLLLKAVLDSISDKEIAVSTDPETSVVLQRLIYSMNDFAKRVLLDRFEGQIAALSKNRFASHIIQTLFQLGSDTVERESRGIIARGPNEESTENELPLMSELICNASKELCTDLRQQLWSQFGVHVIQAALYVLSGRQFTDETQVRSKKSQKWKSRQGPFKSFVQEDDSNKGKGREHDVSRIVPQSFMPVLDELLSSLKDILSQGKMLKESCSDPVSGPLIKLLLEIEYKMDQSNEKGSFLDLVLDGLVSLKIKHPKRNPEPSEFIETMIKEETGSHIIETALTCSSDVILSAIWSTYFKGKLSKLANHAVTNFVIAKAISNLDKSSLKDATSELRAGQLNTLITNSRTGVIRALCERCSQLDVDCDQFVKAILGAFEVRDENDENDIRDLVSAVLSLAPLSIVRKNQFEDGGIYQLTTQGSHLAQTWLKMPQPYNSPLIKSILGLSDKSLLKIGTNTSASHVLDVLLKDCSMKGLERRDLILKLAENLHKFADDRIGSHIADRVWDTCDVYLRNKVAESIVQHEHFLRASHYGHFFIRRLSLPLYNNQPELWKQKMAEEMREKARQEQEIKKRQQEATEEQEVNAKESEASSSKNKKRKKTHQDDEIDVLFAGKQTKKSANKVKHKSSSSDNKTPVQNASNDSDLYNLVRNKLK